jgi:MHS family metabolite:H+ symporter-like MFS transporter
MGEAMRHSPFGADVSAQDGQRGPVDPVQLRRATLTSSVGSALEYYDFAIYGAASALVFGKVFFPELGGAKGTVASFATYGVGFLARPLGGLFFGSLGDRRGRKAVLIATILLMGIASTLIGALPTAASAGALAPVLLVCLRLLQGFGAGAEQAGASTLMAEFAPVPRRGFFAALPFVGIQAGTLLAAGTFALVTLLPDEAFLAWGWRIPFLLSAVLIVVAVYIRLRMQESPTFSRLQTRREVESTPVRSLLRTSRRPLLTAIGLRMAENGTSSIYATLSIAFLTTYAGVSKSLGPIALAGASLVGIFSVPFFGALSDRVGRRRVYRGGAVFQLLFAVPAFALLSTGSPVVACVVIAAGIGIGVNGMLGPQCAYLAELFGCRHRYTGVAMGREFSAVLAGGSAPLLGAALLSMTGGAWWVISGYIVVLSAITLATTYVAPETAGRDLNELADADGDVVAFRGRFVRPAVEAEKQPA